jgi:hypothetical protein
LVLRTPVKKGLVAFMELLVWQGRSCKYFGEAKINLALSFNTIFLVTIHANGGIRTTDF